MEEICHENSEINTIIVIGSICFAIFGIVFGLLFALLNRYKTEIKIWLYSHNITWSISEYSLDKDKKYDAFISFSQKDEDLVANHLVPGLEKGAIHFKLCLHYRDWVVGDWIPAQITRSVDESRRTIIVLSQNFLDSVWGLMEFRTAYVSALNERRSRLIVILYGDVSTEKLDPELRAYLAMNTYIKWGDNWFWEKLRYALPHKPQRNENITNKIIVSDKLNPLQLT